MKKIIISGLSFILLGFILGNIFFMNKDELLTSLNKVGEKYYFLEEGIYSDKEILENELINPNKKIIEYKNNKFYIYQAITKDEKIANKLVNIYKERGLSLTVKEKYLKNEEFSTNVSQFDLLMKSATTDDEILKIEEVILANYEEIIKKS